ncbi:MULTISPECIES: hypothetical protein [unclassified Acinetobacter]|uniref:hypothetical protein n=1 Tax=unclassified Acinetobacter TaxID=196816 RepID=UPI0015D3C62C|nr:MULTISPECIES: hypothetical protein [unclassified Acinetobacter]
MNTISPYLLRVYNPTLEVNDKGKIKKGFNSLLNDINGLDLFDLLKKFITTHNDKFYKVEDDKRRKVYKFYDVKASNSNRFIYGWFLEGEYGLEKDIIDINSSDIEFKRRLDNAEITKHFFYIKLPLLSRHGLVLLHNFNGNGVKTTFHDEIVAFTRPQLDCFVSMTPLSDETSLKKWSKAVAKEIRLNKFIAQDDIADTITDLGYEENNAFTLTVKPPIRGGNFGTLAELTSKKKKDKPSKKLLAVEILSEHCKEVKTVFELNGKRRTFRIGNGVSNILCEIEAPEELLENPTPEFDELKKWAFEVAEEFSSEITP